MDKVVSDLLELAKTSNDVNTVNTLINTIFTIVRFEYTSYDMVDIENRLVAIEKRLKDSQLPLENDRQHHDKIGCISTEPCEKG